MMPTLVKLIGTANLLLLSTGGLAVTLGLLLYIIRSFAAHFTTSVEPSSAETQRSVGDLLKNRYVIFIFGLIIVWWVGFFFIENIFYDRVAAQFPLEEQLAGFLGLFFAVIGILTLLSGTFVSGPVISRYGLWLGILVLPMALAAGTVSMTVTGVVLGATALFFWLAALTKLLNMTLGFSIDRSALTILYQPLPVSERGQTQTMAEGIVQPLAIGLAGVALLPLTTFFAFGAIQLSYALLFIVVIWIGLAIRLGREYRVALTRALAKRQLNRTSLLVADRSSITILQQSLDSPHAGVVLYSLDMLEALEPESFSNFLQNLLGHTEREVRLDVLSRIERLGLTSALPAIRQRVKYEGSKPVRAASWRTLAALGDSQVLDEVYPYLEGSDLQIRQGAMVGLLQSGELEGILTAGERLLELVNSPDPTERECAAQMLGQGGISAFYRPVLKLLGDDSPQVQRAALTAAGKLKNPKLWPVVIGCLAMPKVRSTAVATLVDGGEEVLPQLKSAIFAKKEQDRQVLIQVARICGRIRGPKAVALLQNYLDFPDESVRSQVLLALNQCGYQAEIEQRSLIQSQIKAEVTQATWVLTALVKMGDDSLDPRTGEAVSLLKTALNHNLTRHRARLFLWLSFIYDSQLIFQVRDALDLVQASTNGKAGQQRAYALEIIDILISSELKAMLLPLLDNLSPLQRLQRLSDLFPQPNLSFDQYLQEIITGPNEWLNPWTKVCALYAIGRLAMVDLAQAVITALAAPEPLVRETAVWILAGLDVDLCHKYAGPLNRDPSLSVVKAVRSLDTASEGAADGAGGVGGVPPLSSPRQTPGMKPPEQGFIGDEIMLMLVEKVICLKAVDFFTDTSEEVLADVAANLEELEIKAGQTILEKGEINSAMYIIVDGQVRLQDGQRTITKLDKNEVFGELSILNPDPQPAAVTALTDTRLLCLDQELLREVLEDHGVLAWRVMQRLAQRLQRVPIQGRSERTRDDLLGGLKEELIKKEAGSF